MTDELPIEAAVLYGMVVISLGLSVLAVAFAFRLSRITGLFGAWSLLIVGLGLTVFEDLAYFSSVVFVSHSELIKLVQTYSAGSFFFAGLILLAIPAAFFGSMYKLHHIFRAQRLSSAAAAATT